VQVATQIPIVVALALLILQLRKSETEERLVRDEGWKLFLKQRDEQHEIFFDGIRDGHVVMNATILKELNGVSMHMQAVTVQMQAVNISLERLSMTQDHSIEEMKGYITGTKPLNPESLIK
jgi:hypothetical protein